MEPLANALLLAGINTGLVNYLKTIINGLISELNQQWFLLVALATGAGIGWFADVNLLIDIVENDVLGRVLTALAIGGGSSLIHDIFDN